MVTMWITVLPIVYKEKGGPWATHLIPREMDGMMISGDPLSSDGTGQS